MSKQVDSEILVVGNEILNGTTLDTNSYWLSKQLNNIGVKVERKTVLRDDLVVISLGIKQIFSRHPDWLFSMGGLGPTYDDLTVQGLSTALKKELRVDHLAIESVKESYKRRGVEVTRLSKASLKMATIPVGSVPLPNPVGAAPGILARSGITRIVLLPGVPSEMKAIFLEQILPILKRERGFVVKENWVRVAGIGESKLAPELSRIYKKHRQYLYVKSHPAGIKKGKPVVNIQIILTTPTSKSESGAKLLNHVTISIVSLSQRLGAKADIVKLVG